MTEKGAKPLFRRSLAADGFELIEDVFGAELEAIEAELPSLQAAQAGRRDVHASAAAVRAAGSPQLRAIVGSVMGERARVVRALLFDKTPARNWRVPFHQDLTIAVAERRDVPGFGPWRQRDGALNVVAPSAVLSRMLAMRIHFDDALATSGALRVVPGSHGEGRLSPPQIAEAVRVRGERAVEARRGDVLLMRPLLLHASSPATVPSHRRVLHLELAADDLPSGLRWAN